MIDDKKFLITELNKKKKLTKKQLEKICKQYSVTKSFLYGFITFSEKYMKKLSIKQ